MIIVECSSIRIDKFRSAIEILLDKLITCPTATTILNKNSYFSEVSYFSFFTDRNNFSENFNEIFDVIELSFKHNKKRIRYKHWYIYPKFVNIETDKPKVKFVYGSKWVTPKDTLYFCGDFDTLEECKAYLKEYYESNLEIVETIG